MNAAPRSTHADRHHGEMSRNRPVESESEREGSCGGHSIVRETAACACAECTDF